MKSDKMSSNVMVMSNGNEQMIFENALCERVKELREGKGWVAEQMAIALGIPPERYRKYESRSLLPHYLIPKFAIIVDRTAEFVLTGKEARATPKVSRGHRIGRIA